MKSSTVLDWSHFAPPASWTQNGREYDGCCPVTGDGKTKAWTVPDDNVIGCRLCGDGSGKLTGSTFREHAAALGLIDDVHLSGGGSSWESWTWTAADGRTRLQYRAPHGKRWARTDPPNTPRPADLLYMPMAITDAPVVYCLEGASDADAVHTLGLPAIGRTNARPSAESLARLPRGALYLCWPDVDDDHAGYRQAITWYDAATAVGLRCEVIDPLALRPDAPAGYDASDWIAGLPDGTDAAGAAARLEAAAGGAVAARLRRTSGTPRTPAAATAPPAAPVIPADGLPIPRQWTGTLCDSEEDAAQAIRRTAAGRLAFVHKLGDWLTFGPRGWQPVHKTTLEEACADFARLNIGSSDKNGDLKMAPRSTGRKSVGRAITQLLEPMVGTELSDWDAAPNVIMMPDGVLLDVFTGARRPSAPADRIRRRVPVAPASEPEYTRSVFRRVIEHVIPAPDERAYLQRRLGAALVNAEGMDDLIWVYGPPGAGKGTLLHALAQTFGDYGKGVPVNELIKGVQHDSHPAWKARLAGARILFADDVRIGHELEDSTVNLLLGSQIVAHHMRQESFEFRLNAPLLVTSNGGPRQATSNVRRLKPIECGPQAETEDPTIRAAMSTPPERAACLRWLIVGAFQWKREGCPVPASIRARARDVAALAPVAQFTQEFAASARVTSGEVWTAWQQFVQSHGGGGLAKNQTALAALLKAHGWRPSKSNGIRYLTPPDPVSGSGRVGCPIDLHMCAGAPRASTTSNPTLPDPDTGERPGSIENTESTDLPPLALGTANGGGDHRPPPSTPPADDPAIPPPRQPEVPTMPDDPPAPPITPPDGDQPAPPADDGRGEFVGILRPNPTVTNRADCPRCFGSGQTATGAPCLDCQPLAVYLDRTRPLSADALAQATAYMDRLRATAAASNGNGTGPVKPPRMIATLV